MSINVTEKAGKQRRLSIGHKAAQVIERYLRKRQAQSEFVWLTTGNRGPFATNGLRMALEHRFQEAEVTFLGAHAFRRGCPLPFLAAGGQEGATEVRPARQG